MKKLFLLLFTFSLPLCRGAGSVSDATAGLNFHSKSATHSRNPTRQRKKEWRALTDSGGQTEKALRLRICFTVCLDFPLRYGHVGV